MSVLLEIENLHFSYHRREVLRSISLTLRKGEVVALIGPSGAGKSTLLRALALLDRPTHGTIRYAGRLVFSALGEHSHADLLAYRKDVGLVFQELHLWPHMTAMENITLPLCRAKGLTEAEARAKAESLLDTLSLADCASAYPGKLSVGQQQRCAIARTLAMEPSIILLDEITSALDPELVASMLTLIREIASDPQRTLIVVTHEIPFAVGISRRIGYLEDGELLAVAPAPELRNASQYPRIARFIDHTKASTTSSGD